MIVKPETLIGWHRRGFKLFWKWRSRVGRPRLPENIRKLIIRMALENPTSGQARVAAELSVKLGIYVSPRTVRTYRVLIRDRDSIFSVEVDDQLKAFGLRVLRTPTRAPQANAYCERLVGTVRRECLDFMIPLGEKHLSRILAEWVTHYNQGRPHSSLGPGIPEPVEMLLPTQPHGRYFSTDIHKVVARPILGGLHHEYRWERVAA